MSGILSGTAVAATAVSPAALRVYFQDEQGGIREGTYPTAGSSSGWGVNKTAIFTAKLYTPLAVISWDNGTQVSRKGCEANSQIRVYSLSANNTLQEWAYQGSSWGPGYLTSSNFPASSISSLSAVYWSQNGGSQIRLYAQGNLTRFNIVSFGQMRRPVPSRNMLMVIRGSKAPPFRSPLRGRVLPL